MPLDLADFQQEAKVSGKTRRCSVQAVLEAVDDDDRTALQQALAADVLDIPNAAIINVLKRRGHDLSSPALTSHRRGTCSCHRIR